MSQLNTPRPRQRILVIGSGGSGKSTFASRLAANTGLPLIHLDSLYWKPGWIAPAQSEWLVTVDSLLEQERWIIDGNYGGTLDRRLAACDTVVFLDLPRYVCLVRVIQRWIRFWGRHRPDMTPGCPERISLKFLWWIWTYRRQRRPAILQKLAQLKSHQQAVVLITPKQVDEFVATIADSQHDPCR